MAMDRFGDRRGFTLLELSLVILIIGLIAGSILVGRDLIRVAQDRKTVSQIMAVETAVNSFKLKYNAIPGDFDQASTIWPEAIDGNGNGLIEDDGVSLFEDYNAWHHLGLAGLVSPPFAPITATPATPSPGAPVDTTLAEATPLDTPSYITFFTPATVSNNAIMLYGLPYPIISVVHSMGGDPSNPFALLGELWVFVEDILPNEPNPGLWPSDALYIDTKIDDGNPMSGTVIAAPFPLLVKVGRRHAK